MAELTEYQKESYNIYIGNDIEPDIAENIPQATTVDIAKPPFLSPRKAYAAR